MEGIKGIKISLHGTNNQNIQVIQKPIIPALILYTICTQKLSLAAWSSLLLEPTVLITYRAAGHFHWICKQNIYIAAGGGATKFHWIRRKENHILKKVAGISKHKEY